MLYIYTKKDCEACSQYIEYCNMIGNYYEIRDVSRLDNPIDIIDKEALKIGVINSMQLPIVIDYKSIN